MPTNSSSITSTESSYPTQMAGSVPSTGGMVSEVSAAQYAAMSKKSSMKSSAAVVEKRKLQVRVLNSPKGQRVKLVGANLVELAPMFITWADRLGKDLRVVLTDGDAAYQFYGRPMVAQRLGANGLCLFLTGSFGDAPQGVPSWRVGLDELEARKAPSGLDSPEFPAYANIQDEKKTFLARVDGKFIYTMLYVPQRRTNTEDKTTVNGEEKALAVLEPNPLALEPFLTYIFTKYEKMIEDYGDEIRGELTEVSLREFCSDSQRKRERTLLAEVDEQTKKMREQERQVMDLARKIRDAQKDLTLLRSGALNAELGVQSTMMNKLVTDGLFEKFKVRHGRLVGMTTPIVIEHEGKKFDLGQFVVSIKRDGTLAIEHPTKQPPYHPHIHTTGTICLGAIRNDIPKLIGMERYAMVFQVIYEFLGSYNEKDKYNKIEVCTGAERAQNLDQAGEIAGIAAPNQADPREVAPMDMSGINRQTDRDIQRGVERSIQNAMGLPPGAIRSTGPSRLPDWPTGMRLPDMDRPTDPTTGVVPPLDGEREQSQGMRF